MGKSFLLNGKWQAAARLTFHQQNRTAGQRRG
jgi:hypothetical protein